MNRKLLAKMPSTPSVGTLAQKHLPALEALRGLAALFVTSFHAVGWLYADKLRTGGIDFSGYPYLFFTREGAVGVDVFFLLSGFIMIYTTSYAHKIGAMKFLLKRMARILPLYWFCLTAYWILITPATPSIEVVRAAFLFPSSNSSPPFFGYSILNVAWTLTYELLFYGFFAFALLLPSRRLPRGISIALILLASVVGLQLWLGGYVTLSPYDSPMSDGDNPERALIGMMANPLFIYFAIGALLGEGYLILKSHPAELTRHTRLLRLSAAALALISPLIYFKLPAKHGLFGVGASAITIFITFIISDLIGNPIRWKAIAKIGKWSYSIYLVHPIVGAFISLKFPGFWQTGLTIGAYLIFMAITIAIAALLHTHLERPVMDWARDRLKSTGRMGGSTPIPS